MFSQRRVTLCLGVLVRILGCSLSSILVPPPLAVNETDSLAIKCSQDMCGSYNEDIRCGVFCRCVGWSVSITEMF